LIVKLLLDENLSERLLPQLQKAFPGSAHIRPLSLGGAADDTLWTYAAENDFLLVTKDEDFLSLSVRRGFPPKVICLAIGNVSNAVTADCLLSQAKEIEQFICHPEAGFLLLGLNPSPGDGPTIGRG
jgi:predicted nuclease of predicted toxin-antitoxin system